MSRDTSWVLGVVFVVALLHASTPVGGAQQGSVTEPESAQPTNASESPDATSCVLCHGDEDLFEQEQLQIVQGYREGAHSAAGLSCHDCHGGNPDPAIADDMDAAMDESYEPNPYVGVPDATAVPKTCGRCHSSPEYMRRYNPNARVDQEREYWTSQHGLLLKSGDVRVATCTSCHGVHGILAADNPRSSVYPTHVAQTCRGCHSDAERMADYELPNGLPLPIEQYDRWRQSVHAAALLEREDLSAPTCNDCHGNHGAMPPGVQSIAYVCGECHGREADLFRQSPKSTGFETHNELLADAGPDGCAACHSEPEPAAQITDMHSMTECAACHSNHGVVRPTVAMLSPLPETPCVFCHGGPDALLPGAPDPQEQIQRYEQVRDRLLQQASAQGLEAEQRFNWLVDQTTVLEVHSVAGRSDREDQPSLRPEFERLFTKFRIGKTTYTYPDPVTGEPIEARVRRCTSCHAGEDVLGEEAHGRTVAGQLIDRMRDLTSRTARAERILLAAQRGGVQTRDAAEQIDGAVDTQIELEVLLHEFAAGEDSSFVAKYKEGIEHAEAALGAGRQALGELGFRRRGLAVSLVIIVFVLLALGLKIRQLSDRRTDEL
jgi:hypothetical protein